jgi:type VI secretion system protein VasJ
MSYSDPLVVHYLDVASLSVSSESFAGEDVRFSNEYEALEAELNKAHCVHAVGETDWLIVRDCSEKLLRTRCKDLRVGVWLAWALYQGEGFRGLVAGLGMIHHLCEHHWVEIYPRKTRTRAAAMRWLGLRLEQALDDSVAVKAQLPLFCRLAELLDGLDTFCTHHLADEAPLLLPLSRRLKSKIQGAADDRAAPHDASAVVRQARQATPEASVPSASIDCEKEAQKSVRFQQQSARRLCAWWLKQNASDPRALRLNRTLLWLPIETEPEHNAEQITALRGLPADRLKGYRDKYDQARYAELVVELEASLARAPFWFDGQRLVWECLGRLDAERAMREVELHVALFIQRLPGVIDLRFHDGAPFADLATRTWITATVMPRLHTATAAREVEASDAQPAWASALEAALPVLRKEGLKAAVQLLKQGLKSARGERARFFWQLSLARLCLVANKYELANAQLEALDQILQDSGISAWEPDLALEVLQLLHNCLELLPQEPLVRGRKEQVYRRLCHLDLEVLLE